MSNKTTRVTQSKRTDNATQKWAGKKTQPVTADDVPGSGAAKKAAKAIENAHARRKKLLDSL